MVDIVNLMKKYMSIIFPLVNNEQTAKSETSLTENNQNQKAAQLVLGDF